MLTASVALLFLVTLTGCANETNSHENNGDAFSARISAGDAAFLDTLQHRSFLYFLKEINPSNGLVRDRSTSNSPASIAAVGFALPIWAVGAEHGWISRSEAAHLTLTCLRFLGKSEQSDDTLATGYRGFFYHFLDMQTGRRVWRCELSTIDTALLIAGIRFTAQYYKEENREEREIRGLADSLTNRVDWDWMTLPNEEWYANSVSMGWHPERGFLPSGWVGYNEALILYIIAAGSGYSDIEAAIGSWYSHYDWAEPYSGLAHLSFPPLFGHQYSQIFVDFRGLTDDYTREKGLDYFENSRRATLVQRQYAIDNPNKWVGYDSLCWGLTAGDGPGSAYNRDNQEFHSYTARGTSGRDRVQFDDGTIAPTAAASSIAFAPEVVIPTLRTMYERYGTEGLWGPYGFYDGFNPTVGWYGPDYIGIDQGPIVLMIENFRSGLIWNYMMQDTVIQKGLAVLRFTKKEKMNE